MGSGIKIPADKRLKIGNESCCFVVTKNIRYHWLRISWNDYSYGTFRSGNI